MFEFHIYGKANIYATLSNIPEGKNLDLILYAHNEADHGIKPNSHGDNKITQIAESLNKLHNPEIIELNSLLPNVYYLKVFSPNCDRPISNYTLELMVAYTPKDASITELKYQKGAKAAVWVSDYDPYGIRPFTEKGNIVIGNGNRFGENYTWTNPMFGFIEGLKRIHHASIYVWDPVLRNVIASAFDGMRTELTKQRAELEEELRVAEDTQKEIEVAVKIGQFVIGAGFSVMLSFATAGVSSAVQTVVFSLSTFVESTLVDTVSYHLLKGLMETLFPCGTEENINKLKVKLNDIQYLINYFGTAKIAMECGADTNEVAVIHSYYSSQQKGYDHIIDFKLTEEEIYDTHIYSEDIIHSFSPKAHFYGTIYPFNSDLDWTAIYSKEDPSMPDVNTSEILDISEAMEGEGTLVDGKYYWFTFRPQNHGKYSFTSHSLKLNLRADLFYQAGNGVTMEGILAESANYNGTNDFKIDYEISPVETVYLRVRSINWKGKGNFNVFVNRIGEPSNTIQLLKGSDFPFHADHLDPVREKSMSLFDGYNRTIITWRLNVSTVNDNVQFLAPGPGSESYLSFFCPSPVYRIDLKIAVSMEIPDGYGGTYFEAYSAPTNAETFEFECCGCGDKIVRSSDRYEWRSWTLPQPANNIKLKFSAWSRGYSNINARALVSDLAIYHVDYIEE